MRIAVVGASGRVGGFAVAALRYAGHEPVGISRSTGVDAYTGQGLDGALAGVDAVIDASNTGARDESEIVDFFGTTSRNLLDAEQRAGVRHHVLLSIVGIDRVHHNPHYAGKLEQERRVTSSPIPWSIVRATQFHDFAAMVAGWAEHDGVAPIAPLLVQPVDIREVGEVLAEVAAGEPLRDRLEMAGPRTEDLVDMARRTFAVRGQHIELEPTWRGMFDVAMAGEALLPAGGARLAATTFADWLAAGAR